jgi:hypothetical protein
MNLNDLLMREGYDPKHILIFRHRPHETKLNKVFPWLVAERHDLFNAYQATQETRLERTMEKLKDVGYVASFVGRQAGAAVFAGLYHIAGSKPLTYSEFWEMSVFKELHSLGMRGWYRDKNKITLLFDLRLCDFYTQWKGKLTIEWPPPEIAWWRRAHHNVMPIVAIHENSVFEAAMPAWYELDLTWKQLGVMPRHWKNALRHWRGIYHIFDESNGKGYVGSAYGKDNILGRWLNYAATGHGGNNLLRKRNPDNFHFSILQRVSPDMEAEDVIRLENSWKQRLHTRKPDGLNDN